jgi:hypothetical protein
MRENTNKPPEKRFKIKGIVRFLNLQNGLVAVETNEGFTVFEIRQRCALDIGDEVTGPLDSLGEEILHNITKEESFDVSIENIHCNRTDAIKSLA